MKTSQCLLLAGLCSFVNAAFAGVEQTVNELIPKLASEEAEERQAPQMELQSIALRAARPGAEAERLQLAELLAAKAADAAVPQPARVWVVRQLEYIGGAESVSALTALLAGQNAELAECARRALEKNSAPAASASLRAALQRGRETTWKVGLIHSLGERRDAESVSLIANHLDAPDTAAVAASALSKIAADAAVKALWRAFDKKTPGAADALIDAANRLASSRNASKAAAIYTKLYAAVVPSHVHAAALVGLAHADPKEARKRIGPALASGEVRLQTAAILVAKRVYGKDASRELARLLPRLSAPAKVHVLRALDPSAERQALEAANDSDPSVQLAALETLGRIGSHASVPLLLKAAAGEDATAKRTSRTALAEISGAGVDAAIAKAAAEGDAKSRAAAIKVLAARHDKSALPALLRYAGEADPTVSSAACAAVGTLGGEHEMEGLARLVLGGSPPGAESALQAVAGRVKDKPAAARRLLALAQDASARQVRALFDVFTILGGSDALAWVSAHTSSSDPETKDAAIRALSNWPDFAAARPLLSIATDPNATRVHNVLAIQGVARLVKASEKEPAAARLEAAQKSLDAAQRDEEQKLLLSALASVPHPKAAEALKPFLTDPKFRTEAGLAGVSLAEALLKADAPAARQLAQAVKDAGISDQITKQADEILKK